MTVKNDKSKVINFVKRSCMEFFVVVIMGATQPLEAPARFAKVVANTLVTTATPEPRRARIALHPQQETLLPARSFWPQG